MVRHFAYRIFICFGFIFMADGRAFRCSPRPKVVSAIAFAGASCRQPCLRKPQSTLVLRAATPIPAAIHVPFVAKTII